MSEELPPGWSRIPEPPWSTSEQTIALEDGRLLRLAKSQPAMVFDWRANAWVEIPPPHVRATRRGLVVMPEGWVLATGGTHEGGDALDGCELYDPARNAWRSMPALPAPRYGHACAAVRGRIYVIGGKTRGQFGQEQDMKTALSWAPGEGAWASIADLPRHVSYARTLVLDDDSIVCSDSRGTLRWAGGAWTELGGTLDSALARYRGGFIAVGGSTNSEAIGRVRVWQGAWSERPDLPKPRKGARAVQLRDERIAIIGGHWTETVWEDTSTGGELDWEYRSFHAWVVNEHYCHDVLVEDGDGWRTVPSPQIHGHVVLPLPNGKIVIDRGYVWAP